MSALTEARSWLDANLATLEKYRRGAVAVFDPHPEGPTIPRTEL